MGKQQETPELCISCGEIHYKADPPYCTKNRDKCPKDAEIAALKAEVARLREALKMCVEPLREASKADYADWKECRDTADVIEDTLKQLEAKQ